jgi:hypothetical protein
MPIMIKELHIRVSVAPTTTGRPAGAPGPGPGADGEARQALVAECVEQVLQVLHDKQER